MNGLSKRIIEALARGPMLFSELRSTVGGRPADLREALEETSLDINLKYQLGAYSDPERDPRHHTISVVFVAGAEGVPKAADDAIDVGIFSRDSIPDKLAFDHGKILYDYFEKCFPKKQS